MKHIQRPCDECPWRLDAEPGRFEPERWTALARSSTDERGFGADFDAPLFACHKTPDGKERAARAGWPSRGSTTPGSASTCCSGRSPSAP